MPKHFLIACSVFVLTLTILSSCEQIRPLLINVDEDALRADITANFWFVDTVENCPNFIFSDTTIVNFSGMSDQSQEFTVERPYNLPNVNNPISEFGRWTFSHSGMTLEKIMLDDFISETSISVVSFTPGAQLVIRYNASYQNPVDPDVIESCEAIVTLSKY